MDNSSIVNEWVKFANADLSSAKLLIKHHPAPIEIICFHCHQSAEKLLKAFLIKNSNEVSKTHDLKTLLKTCISENANFEKLLPNCVRLDPYSIQTRYPYGLDLNENDAEMAISDAEVVKDYVLSTLQS